MRFGMRTLRSQGLMQLKNGETLYRLRLPLEEELLVSDFLAVPSSSGRLPSSTIWRL